MLGVFGGAIIIATAILIALPFTRSAATHPDSKPEQKPEVSAQQQTPARQETPNDNAPSSSKPENAPSRKRHPIKLQSPSTPTQAPGPTQDGAGNQQTNVQAPITQSNSGGCNQQVFGGNNNTNNCVPPERHLTEEQKTGLVALAQNIPKKCTVAFSSANDAEPIAFAKEIHDLWGTVNTTGTTLILLVWHVKGIVFQVKSADAPCTPYGLLLANGMKGLGIDVSERRSEPKHERHGDTCFSR